MVNYIAVVVAALVPMVLGFLWYGPLFGKQWMKLSGMTMADMDKAKAKGMGKTYAVSMVGALVMSYVLAKVVGLTGSNTLIAGAMLGFWVWLGFVATTLLNSVTYEGKSWELYYLNVGYYLVALVVMGGLLASWA